MQHSAAHIALSVWQDCLCMVSCAQVRQLAPRADSQVSPVLSVLICVKPTVQKAVNHD